MAHWFDLLKIHDVCLHGKELGKLSYFPYIPPRELLRRLLEVRTVFEQYLSSGKQSKMYEGLGVWYSDFFQSEAYTEILKTLPPEEPNSPPPLLLEIYRLVTSY